LTLVARKVSARLKPNSLTEFVNLMEGEILPWLRKQEGFLDLITLAVPNGSEVATISFWDDKGNAQAFNSSGYPEAVKLLEKLLDGTPYVKTFEVVSSTLQSVALAMPPEEERDARSEGRQGNHAEGPILESLKRSLVAHY
jgi:heme-degrading monooxygenase HmoA